MNIQQRSWKKPPCVILACGSFSPPTYLHLRIMEEARDCLCDTFEVIGGILSPVNDQYATLHKPSLKAANGTHRAEMSRLATQSSEWIGVSDFEVSLDKWTRVAVVMEAYGKALDYHFISQDDDNKDKDDERKINIKFVGGSDLLSSMKTPNLWREDHQEIILGRYGFVVVERVGHELDDEYYESYEMFKKYRNNIHHFLPAVENTISSTKVRELLANNRSAKYLTPDSVIEYVNKEGLYKQ